MISSSSSPSLRHKPNIVALSGLVLFVFALASLALSKLNDRIEDRRSSYSYARDIIGFAPSQNNRSDFLRLGGVGPVIVQGQRRLIFAQFRLDSGVHHAGHTSRPYFVRIDNETGAFVKTIEYGHDHHPLSRLVDVRELREAERESIFFFVVPKVHGDHMKTIMTNCYNLRRTQKREDPESMTFIRGVLNVDTQTREGLARSRAKNIVDSGFVDVFATSFFLEGTMLFKPKHKGRAFTILQHPVIRAESLYRSQSKGLLGTFWRFLDSPHYIDNWVVRSLTNDKLGVLSEDHFIVAKGILAGKFFVGIAEHLEETIKRLESYYGWSESKEGCVINYLKNGRVREEESSIERGGYEWQLVLEKDKYDLMLYYYALELFAKQGSTMFNRPYVDKAGKPIDFTQLKRERDAEKRKNKLLSLVLGS